ncbi:biotin--[acetyl-CoA-carboxylase] ligase [Rhodovibrio salinarum]|uniref:biotin--[biotin carboxyl-carrier protein] ligase n=1 Tax=Rhodovibrio salinarum TaxID=1087 RepID=A0A934V0D2_9PROT|nr:biotin--[acetyl-CoA-carboxylase] ligase [Rhodovibrio salinarum]MBK1697678.1 biotin--[acetyl-CoA-carboxylase] ligase [Rhodovibrio salinarum]
MNEASRTLKLPPAYRLRAYDALSSTNDEARRLVLEEAAEDGTLVWGLEQTAGRGRRGRSWSSPRGNLYLTAILRPDCAVAEAAQLGFAAALALVDALGHLMPPLTEVRLKWPNDVLVNDRKVAGILLETVIGADGSFQALLLGVGVNVADAPDETAFPATALHWEGSGHGVAVEDLLAPWAKHFLAWVNRWLDDGFAPLRRQWLTYAHQPGQPLRVRLPNREVHGTFQDMDETGALLIDTAGGRERLSVGDVFFAAPEGAQG